MQLLKITFRSCNNYMAIIYKVTSPSNKIYIGITKQTFGRRKAEHYYKAFNKKKITPFYCALRKYKELMVWEILEEVITFQEAKQREKYYIKLFNSYIRDIGYNLTLGGEGTEGFYPSLETRKKLSKAMKGRDKGKKYSKEFGIKLAIAQGAKPFLVYDKHTKNVIGEWINKTQCAKELNLHTSCIIYCLNGKLKSTGGYTFCYKEVCHS